MTQVIEKFLDFYRSFSPASLNQLGDIYESDVVFEDPITKINGLADLEHHFSSTMQGMASCDFVFNRVEQGASTSYVEWCMYFSHPRLESGRRLTLDGISVIESRENGKVISHRDYYDMGQMVYENVPILRRVIRRIKGKLSKR